MATIIEMPKLSDTMTVGTLVSWLKKEGDKVASGDKVAEIETDKATMEMEVFEDGVLLKQIVAEGEQVTVGDPICAIGKEGEKVDVPAKKPKPAAKSDAKKPKTGDATAQPTAEPEVKAAPAKAAKEETQSAPKTEPAPSGETTAPEKPAAPRAGAERLAISPLARKLAAEKGVDPSALEGSGPGGRIIRADILAAAQSPKPAAKAAAGSGATPPRPPVAAVPGFVGTSDAPVQEESVVQASNMRATIARRLVEAKSQIPHFYVEVEIDAGPLLALREQVNAVFGDAGKLSVNDFVLKACAHALRRVSNVNCSWEEDSIHRHAAANISFAVAIEDGLITPVVFNAHAKSVFQISAEVRALAARAKARKLKPDEFTGGTFCVSNLGMFGVDRFSAIINPPNGAILAVGAAMKKPVVNAQGELAVGQRMSLTLSCDHRVVDGATGAEFLAALREILEKPLLALW